MEEELRALLLANAGVTALVAQRVTWNIRPQGSALPSIVLWLTNAREGYGLRRPDGVTDHLVQLDCWGVTVASAKATARAARAALTGYSGGTFQGVFIEGQRDSADDEKPTTFFRSSLDVRVWRTAA